MDAPKQRTSLTKTQLQTGAGLELLSICQSITADGRVADEEIEALNHWIRANSEHDLPAIRFLSITITRVLEDGIITPEERLSVAKAIEAVLPPDERKYASALRRQIDQEDRQKGKAAAEQERLEARIKRQQNTPIGTADFMVSGTRHEGRGRIIAKEVRPGMSAFLQRDKGNAFSPRAIAVITPSGRTIGYVPEDYALDIAPLLDDGALHSASFKKVLDYDTGPVPVVIARLYSPGASLPDAKRQDQAPTRSSSTAKPVGKPPAGTTTKAWLITLGIIALSTIVLALRK